MAAALRASPLGLIDNWLRHIQDTRDRYPQVLHEAGDNVVDRLCEVNVLEQALNVCRTTVVRDAWNRGQTLAVNAWIYSVADGLVRDLGFCVTAENDSVQSFDAALDRLSPGASGLIRLR